jgi:DNA polymerase III epsilon subunit-like protein
MSLYSIIKSLNLQENLSKPELYNNIKLINDYIQTNLSSANKPDLISLIQNFKKYLENKTEILTDTFVFGDKPIKLDTEQLEVVHSSPSNNLRVLAGAGSGKTTTILCRIKYLLDNFTTPDRILILTFNRDSAQNLRTRTESLFHFNIKLQIYTIDAFCYKIFNYYHYDEMTKQYYSLSEYSNIGLEIMKKYSKEITSQYKYIFFDEFQDVNDVQFNILKIFVDNGCALTVIGDDCQNIYQFRGTNNYYMINFDKIINSHTYKLTTNYRSNKYIVNLANKSISYNEIKVDKEMKAHNIESNSDLKPKFVLTGSESDSITYICKKIKLLIANGIKLDDIAVLSRNSYPLKQIETAFTKENIDHIACLTDKNSDDIKKILVPNKIAVTTIHKSKGLEFSYVFIINFNHGTFPSSMNSNIKNIEEERRLFYVGITRAKNYLYLVASIQEIPISTFIEEIYGNLVNVRYHLDKKYTKEELFSKGFEDKIIKESYGVNELVTLFKPEDLANLRNLNLILNTEPVITNIIEDVKEINFQFDDNIKSGAYEADLGEFSDRYITRQLIINAGKKFTDSDTEFIIKAKEIGEEDMSIINLLKSNPNILNTSKTSNPELKNIIEIIESMGKSNLNVVRKYTYPQNIIKILTNSYNLTQNPKLSNTQILESIYWISLCRNFRNDRNRLVYKNIFKMIKTNVENQVDNTNLLNQMDNIILIYSKIKTDCKINLIHKFKSNFSKICAICGEIDLIDLDNNELIDFKCSETNFKLEWMLQLLIYYSLYPNKDTIKYIGVINIFTGKKYRFEIPEEYDGLRLIKYIEEMIKLDQLSIRPQPSIYLENNNDNKNDNKEKEQINLINLNFDKTREHSMILDTETSDFNGDILQLAWVILDSTNKIVTESNYYIKDRISSKEAYQIHNISLQKLRKEGKDFVQVIKLFIKDLEKSSTIIGHNVQYDLRCLLKNLRKYDVYIKIANEINYNIFDMFDILCTKKLSGGKSLENLHEELFKTKFLDAHDALVDVSNTYKCYVKLLEKIKEK